MTTQNPLFIPGPTNIPDRLRAAMNVQTMDHRAPGFAKMLPPLLEDLKQVFKTHSAEIVLFPGSGTGGWEAAISNTLSPGDTVLAARYGMFSQRWIDLCEKHGLNVEVIETAWGEAAPAKEIGERLAADTGRRIKAVLATHNETATGVVSDIAAVRQAIDAAQHPALFFVDGVSSIASMDFQMDAWGVDIAVTGSQKGFMLATGLAILAVSQKALTAMAEAQNTRAYFDIRDMLAASKTGGYPYTPALPLVMGLREAVDMLLEEGLEAVFARHHHLAEGVRKAVAAWGLTLVARDPLRRSDTVTTIYVPDGFDGNRLVEHAYHAYDVSYGIGLGQLAGKAFRIGHLGSLTETMVLSGLSTIEMAMKDLNFPIQLGSGVAAAQDHFRKPVSTSLQEAA